MNSAPKYERGLSMLVRIEGHPEPVAMTSIVRPGFVAGGGLMLIFDRANGEVEKVLAALNADSEQRAA